MRKRILFCLSIVILLFSNLAYAQKEIFVSLPSESETMISAGFYIKRVLDQRENQKSIGVITLANEDKTNYIILRKGALPEFTEYFNRILPYSPGKYPVNVILKSVSVSEEITDSSKFITSEVKLDFYLEKNGAISKVYSATALKKKRSVENNEQLIQQLLVTAIRDCLVTFSTSSWKKHPFYDPGNISSNNNEEIEPEEKNNNKKLHQFSENDLIFSRFRLSLEGGYAYWNYKTPSFSEERYTDYFNKLKNGMNLSGDFCIYFAPNYGAGLKFTNFFSGNSLNNVPVYDNNDSVIGFGKLKQQIRIRYIGPMLSWRSFMMSNKLIFTGSLSAGWVTYEEDFDHIYSYFFNGSDFGMKVTLGLEYDIASNATLGIVGGYTHGKLENLEANGFSNPVDNDYDVSHFTLNVALRIYK